jgi:hypothetical protein
VAPKRPCVTNLNPFDKMAMVMKTTATNSEVLFELRGTVPRSTRSGYIEVPLVLDNIALRVVQSYEKTKTLRGHSTLERGCQHHLMRLFMEIHIHQAHWQSAFLMGLKHKLEALIQETSQFLAQEDMEHFGLGLRTFRRSLVSERQRLSYSNDGAQL